MFKVLDLSIALQSTEKSYTFPLKDTSFKSLLQTSLDMPSRQNWDRKLTFPLLALNRYISFLLTNK